MNRKRKSLWTLLGVQLFVLATAGCINRQGLSLALADDLAFTVAAATQGFLTGVFTRNDIP